VIDVLLYDVDEEIVELEMEDGRIISMTKDHKVLTRNRGWIQAQYLNEDDDIEEIEEIF
jgi:intein/homing endonuclease